MGNDIDFEESLRKSSECDIMIDIRMSKNIEKVNIFNSRIIQANELNNLVFDGEFYQNLCKKHSKRLERFKKRD